MRHVVVRGRGCRVHLRRSALRRSTTSPRTTERFIVVLNDNEWSIAKNVGAIAATSTASSTNPTYAHLHDKGRALRRGDRRQERAPLAHKVEEGVKNLLAPERDLRGTRVSAITARSTATTSRCSSGPSSFLKKQDEPVLLHILTKKGQRL